jgi:hypothetical protein
MRRPPHVRPEINANNFHATEEDLRDKKRCSINDIAVTLVLGFGVIMFLWYLFADVNNDSPFGSEEWVMRTSAIGFAPEIPASCHEYGDSSCNSSKFNENKVLVGAHSSGVPRQSIPMYVRRYDRMVKKLNETATTTLLNVTLSLKQYEHLNLQYRWESSSFIYRVLYTLNLYAMRGYEYQSSLLTSFKVEHSTIWGSCQTYWSYLKTYPSQDTCVCLPTLGYWLTGFCYFENITNGVPAKTSVVSNLLLTTVEDDQLVSPTIMKLFGELSLSVPLRTFSHQTYEPYKGVQRTHTKQLPFSMCVDLCDYISTDQQRPKK